MPVYGYSTNGELARIIFPVESANNIKTEIICHRIIGDGCIW